VDGSGGPGFSSPEPWGGMRHGRCPRQGLLLGSMLDFIDIFSGDRPRGDSACPTRPRPDVEHVVHVRSFVQRLMVDTFETAHRHAGVLCCSGAFLVHSRCGSALVLLVTQILGTGLPGQSEVGASLL